MPQTANNRHSCTCMIYSQKLSIGSKTIKKVQKGQKRSKIVRHGAENVRHCAKNVRHGAENVRHGTENVQHGAYILGLKQRRILPP